MSQDDFDYEVAIIGTGFAGMGVAIALKRAGISDFIMLEKSDDIGGTWRDNQYPGACCDVPSQLYSFSYELNPDWSQRYSPAEEIHAYQQHVMDKYKLRQRCQVGFEVDTASFSDTGWQLVSTRGKHLRVRYIISAIGALHIPNKPQFAGLNCFKGKLMHSAQWDKTYDYSNKNIIVVGSAASATQIIPQLAKTAKHVHVIQRTASYFLYRRDRTISKIEKWLLRRLPFLQRLIRWRQYCFNDFLFHPNFMNKPSVAKAIVHYLVNRHLIRHVSDPTLIDKLTPDYEIGCKRLLLSDDIFPALQQRNVTLVTDGIERFTETGLITVSGEKINAELVIMATGFQSSRLFGDMSITGPGGLTMEQAWAKQIRAHRSVAVNGFPNFFMMYGPNSNLGHSSIIIMIEAQARYISRILQHAIGSGRPVVAVRPEAEATYNKDIQIALQKSVWSTACNSWYKDKNGFIFSLWPHSTSRFIQEMRRAPLSDYSFSDVYTGPDVKSALP